MIQADWRRKMDYFQLEYGIFAKAPDLVETIPALVKLKELCPKYIEKAEDFQILARKFARNEILPRFLEIDSKCSKNPEYFDWELWQKINKEKLTIAFIPEEMGGLGISCLGVMTLIEEISSACMPIAANIVFNSFALSAAMVENKPSINLRIIKEMVEAQRNEKPLFWAWAITEPSAGTDAEDARAMATMKPSAHAEKVKGGYRVNGTKCFITNGSLASYVIATICTDPSNPLESMATFLIPSSSKGFSVGRVERKCGQKASLTAELNFDDVFVPDENIWAQPGEGYNHTKEMLAVSRGFVGIIGMSIAKCAMERCIQFAYQKKIKNHRLIDEDWVQMAIADMMKDIKVVRAAAVNYSISVDTNHAARMFESLPVKLSLKLIPEKILLSESLIALAKSPVVSEAGSRMKKEIITDKVTDMFLKEGSALKVAGSDLAMNVTSRVLDIVGLEGMSYKYGIEKCFRDAKLTQIYEGTNQANKLEFFHGEIGAIM
jgi:acyl-CoA dehydrogenase